MSHQAFIQQHQAEIEEELKTALQPIQEAAYSGLHAMMAYHLGWEGPGAGPKASGKRVRPLLVTLTCAAAGGDWRQALPAAAAVELIHNFSLLHDDIEDNSPLRRGRPTVWTQWGIPQAINTGEFDVLPGAPGPAPLGRDPRWQQPLCEPRKSWKLPACS